jgi:hypothetical protein
MAHDVFISYSSKDKPTADAVCAILEADCIRCWIAPRDVAHGKDWGESIIEAINGSRVMVLVLSSSANTSPQIIREVERAVSKSIPVIPLRIEDIKPTASLEYFLSTPHWLDAFSPPLERHLRYLAQVVQKILTGSPQKTFASVPAKPPPSPELVKEVLQSQPPPAPDAATANSAKGNSPKVVWLLAALVFMALLVVAGWWFGSKQTQSTHPPAPPAKPAEQIHEAVATNVLPVETAAIPDDLKRGLVLYYSFDKVEPRGKVTDQSGHGNDGKAVGVQWVADGHQGGAASFGLTDSYITIPNKDELNPSHITLAAWIKTSNQGDTWRRIFDKSYHSHPITGRCWGRPIDVQGFHWGCG